MTGSLGEGSATPSCGGEKGLRLPRSLGRSMRNEGVSDPFPHRKGVSDPFSQLRRGDPVHPRIPLAKIPLAQLHAQYDWTTGAPDNGNEWRKFCAVARLLPLRSLVLYFVSQGETFGL